MKLSIVVAVSRNGVIGAENALPWRLPEDLKHFKAVTMGKPMIMGRKTYDSIGRPLPGRTTLVVTRQLGWSRHGVVTCGSIDDALKVAERYTGADHQEVMIVGGEQIYRQCLPRVSTIYLTEVDVDVDGDAFFPELDRNVWAVESESSGFSEKAQLHYKFVTLTRD